MRILRIALLLGLFTVAGCGSSTAPAPSASIVGTITTPTHGAQAAVGVTATAEGGAVAPRSTLTDSNGSFAYDHVDPGLWTITLDPRTLAAGVLTPHPLVVEAVAGKQVDASLVLDDVVVAGPYTGMATAQAMGAISDTLATLGRTFFPSGPYSMGVFLTALGGTAFDTQWTSDDRQFGGRLVLAGSSVDSVNVAGVDQIPGVGNLECQSPSPNPSAIVLEQDSLTSRARLKGTLVTEWFYDSLGGGLKHETVSIDFDVTHE